VNYYETDGFLENEFLNEKADPVEDFSGQVRFVWKPNDNFTGDLRVSMDDLSTQGAYFDVPRVDEANPFGGYVNDANDVDEPIQLDNPASTTATS
jgi:iron complex outermembrane receptor protein